MRRLAEGVQAPELPQAAIGEIPHAEPMAISLRSADAPPADTAELYRRVAPATVIVRSRDTMGTGVIVGPNGLVLTNHHVVRTAELDDFRMRVTVEYGHIGEGGSMVPEGRQRRAFVLKVDRDRDLAVLRVEEPIAEAPIVALSAHDPGPGETVTTVGHGNVGLVWAVRSCQVQATGRLEEAYARLAAVCGNETERAQQACRELRERMHASMNGLVVQSSCPLAPGDSGGPLVDHEGRLVGLNVMTMRNAENQHSNFHIHARELRDFLRIIPTTPNVSIPSPWIAHERAATQDQDLDGRWDTLELAGHGMVARLFDLDQDTPEAAFDALDQTVARRGFDAELAIVTQYPERFVWYDTDGDGELDLIVTQGEREEARAAHRVRGESVERADAGSGPALAASRVPAAVRGRFERIFEHHLGDQPSPLPAILRRSSVSDGDGDGTPDTLYARQVLVQAIAFDVDQSSLGGTRAEGVEALVREGRFDPEVSLVSREPLLWAFYDRDGNGSLEMGLRTAPRSPVVAATVGVGGPAPRADELIGTLALRADWQGERHDAFLRMAQRRVAPAWVATRTDHAGLPDPVEHHEGATPRASYRDDGWENHVVRMESRGFITSLVDVDRSSFRGRNRRYLEQGLEQAVRERHFSADFAVISTRGAHWTFYDTNTDGTWDLCLVHVTDGERELDNAFRRGRDGTWARDASAIHPRPIRPSLIPARHRRAFTTMARVYFREDLLEE